MKVVASSEIPPETLQLPPCVPKQAKVLKESNHPSRIGIWVSRMTQSVENGETIHNPTDTAPTMYYVVPEWMAPEDVTESAVAECAGDQRIWKMNGKETMHPFWAVSRLSLGDLEQKSTARMPLQFNMDFSVRRFLTLVVGELSGDKTNLIHAVDVPLLTNSSTINVGEQLFLQMDMKRETTKRQNNWKDAVPLRAKAKAKVKDAASKAPPPGMCEMI